MRFAVAMLTIASLGATFAVAQSAEKPKNTKEASATTDQGAKKHKKKSKKHDKADTTHTETK